jgi:hypothetical protein
VWGTVELNPTQSQWWREVNPMTQALSVPLGMDAMPALDAWAARQGAVLRKGAISSLSSFSWGDHASVPSQAAWPFHSVLDLEKAEFPLNLRGQVSQNRNPARSSSLSPHRTGCSVHFQSHGFGSTDLQSLVLTITACEVRLF